MKKLILVFSIISLTTSLWSQSNAEFLKDTLDKTFDKYFGLVGDKGMVAAAYFPDGSSWTKAGGLQGTLPMEADMIYQSGSNSKTFVAAIIMMLKDEGKLSLDDTIYKFMPQQINVDGRITVRQLLQHTAGIYNYTDHPSYAGDLNSGLSVFWTPDTVLKNYVNAPYFSPGASWKYSNTGYSLLGLIIENVEGKPFNQVLKDRVFSPFGYDEMYLGAYDSFTKEMPGTWFSATSYLNTDITSVLSSAWAAGAVLSHPIQLAKWAHDLYGGKILSDSSLIEMTKTSTQSGSAYGLGTVVRRLNGNTYHGHGGAILHYSAMDYSLKSKFGCVAISIDAAKTSQGAVQDALTRAIEGNIAAAPKQKDITGLLDLNQNNEILIYPNPATHWLIIDFEEQRTANVTLVNQLGSIVLQTEVTSGQRLNTSNLPEGMYVINVTTEGDNQVRRILVRH